jgi:hypothetical protein
VGEIRGSLAFALGVVGAGLLVSACGGDGGGAGSPGAGGGAASLTPLSTTPTASSAAADTNPAGDIPDTQKYIAFTLPSGGATLQVPEGWARSQVGGATVFSSHYNSVRVETGSTSSAPTVGSARSSEVPPLQSSASNFALGQIQDVQRSGSSVVLITYEADSAADPVTGKVQRLAVERYEYWRGGTELVLTLSGAVGSDNVDPWRKVSDSVVWS